MRTGWMLGVVLAGCASSPPVRQPGAVEAREEIGRLQARIESLRNQIGVPQFEPPRTFVHESAPADHPVRGEPCQKLDDQTGEICQAAERICALDERPGVAAPPGSCGRAREDCRDVRSLADSCK